ncbi:MAG: hypothetical protein WDZ62_01665 [Candidatus Pacearchaeota archaeon]
MEKISEYSEKVQIEENHKSILEKIGHEGLVDVVWNSLPWYKKTAFPFGVYGVNVYKKILAKSENIDEVFMGHSDEYAISQKFRLMRPKFRKVEKILREKYNIE